MTRSGRGLLRGHWRCKGCGPTATVSIAELRNEIPAQERGPQYITMQFPPKSVAFPFERWWRYLFQCRLEASTHRQRHLCKTEAEMAQQNPCMGFGATFANPDQTKH